MVVEGMMNACGQAVIVICESKEEPLFSTEQVREMISAALLEADIVDANIVVVSDTGSDEEWVDKIVEAAGEAEDVVVWSGKEEVRALFEKKGIKTQKISEVPGISGEEIRKMMKAKDGKWREKVPAGAMDVADRIVSR